MNTNSPIDSGAQPMSSEAFEKANKPQISDEEKLIHKIGTSKEWQYVINYLREREEFYRAYLPYPENPKAVAAIDKDHAELGRMWKTATTVIGEFEGLIGQIERITKSVKQSKL